MCFDIDASPPITPITGGSVAHADLELTSSDGTRFAAFEATDGGEAAVLILPDVRGLFPFYEELALRFAEHGIDAIAIDYFGRTAGAAKRTEDWDFMPHVRQTTLDRIREDVRAALNHLRGDAGERSVFIVGFCFGGSNSWYMGASDLGLSGVVGFYGHPDRTGVPQGAPTVIASVTDISCPVLALQAGDDPGIPTEANDRFRAAMEAAGIDGTVIEYPDAPHSFFDRKQADYSAESADAWQRILSFITEHA
ncbi:MAG TPA: dienelactone hydrolase family protein [Acidimicrobiia bacterium]|nr:dienelactone hydrolase family protein [Acidimicrobiia bacterium]